MIDDILKFLFFGQWTTKFYSGNKKIIYWNMVFIILAYF